MFKNNKIFILGMARSGYEVAKLLAKRNNEIILNDKNTDQDKDHLKELENLGVKVILESHPLELISKDIDYIIKNPGIKEENEMIKRARELNIPVINEVEAAYRLLPKDISIIAVTGSNGKTTTTTIIHEFLKEAELPVHLAGNIGYPLSKFVDEIKPNDILLMEISIQQLCNFDEFKTNISVLTNIYDDVHLEIAGTKDNYINIKKRIFNHHTKDDYAVINKDNDNSLICTNDILSSKEYYSIEDTTSTCYVKENGIYYKDNFIIKLEDIKLQGNHNYQNIMSAIIVAKHFNVSNEVICNVLKNFNGVEHRIEYIDTLNGIEIYNDSKSTNIKASQIALSAFKKPIVLFLGGMDRGQDFNELKDYVKNVKNVICYGETKEKIKEFCDKMNIECDVVDTLEIATKVGFSKCKSGDILLLSPASASWDQFKSFEERGELFKKYIKDIKESL